MEAQNRALQRILPPFLPAVQIEVLSARFTLNDGSPRLAGMTGTKAIRESGQKSVARGSGTRVFGVIPQRFSNLSWSDPVSNELRQLQLSRLRLDGGAALEDEHDAVTFVRSVSFVLRYNATPGLPLAAMFRAVGDKRRAIELTNLLLARVEVIETNLIAERLTLIRRDLVPAVYSLRLRYRSPLLSPNARRALEFINREGQATSGEVRRYLGVAGRKRPDPADLALTELQREMLIDRGPSSVPKTGIPYLSPEGFPYHLFEKTHRDLVRAAGKLRAADAARAVIEAYLRAAAFVTPRKLASIFRLLFSEAEMNSAIAELVGANKAQATKTCVLFTGIDAQTW